MSEPIFREKSLQKVKSPDNLNEYIRVANPSIWLIMAAIIILLIGFCTWAVFGSVKTVVEADVHCENGTVTCYVAEKDIPKIHIGMPVQFGEYTGTVTEIIMRDGTIGACPLSVDMPIPEGIYGASITVESIHPAFFLFN